MSSERSPLEDLEAIVWRLFPALRNVRVILQDLDRPRENGTSLTFHRERPICLSPEMMPVEVATVRPLADLPVVRLRQSPPPNPGPPTAVELVILDMLDASPGLKGAQIAKRLAVAGATARGHLGNLVRRRGWISSSCRQGYTLTDAGRAVLAASRT